jgi:hypothetical protein
MLSRPLAFLLLGLGCVTAAAGGAYVATRHNAADTVVATVPAPQAATASAPSGSSAAQPAAQPVAETEAAVTSQKAAPATATPERADTSTIDKPAASAAAPRRQDRAPARTAPAPSRSARVETPAPPRTAPARTTPIAGATAPQPEPQAAAPAIAPLPAPEPARPLEPQPEAPRPPQFEEVILPASSVVGLQMESSLSSERSRVEDRVEARVTRDVLAGGRVAIPAGSRVLGTVTVVERGGKIKEQARLGVRFHTLILADGSEVSLNTEQITRNGESPAGSSAKKIGGAAVGGAILGAILGGGKGAAIGAGAGAAGGTAATMSGDRNAATLRQGEIINARLTSPATITVERREQ